MFVVTISRETVFSIMWILTIIFAVILVLIRINRNKKIKKTISSFQQGNMDESLVNDCEKLRGSCLRSGQLGAHDIYCYILCSYYIDRDNEDRMIAYFNAFRTDTLENARRMQRLLIQYFSGRKGQDLTVALRKKLDTKMDESAAIKELINESISVDDEFEKKLLAIREQLKRETAINVFDTFVNMVKNGTEDTSASE